jgi:tannase/feruloyl esterase
MQGVLFSQLTVKPQGLLRAALIGSATGLSALASTSAMAAPDCAGLASLKIDNANLLSATEVPAGGDLPAYCRVLGYVRPAINFEIRLPVAGWNGKYYQAGCGGFCGVLASDAAGFTNAMNYGLRRAYAVATSDSGHWGTGAVDGRWAMDNPVAQMDWAQRAATETARVGKIVLKAYYGSEQRKAYFAGCSTGGRIATMEALRYPKDFDGIIGGAPALDTTGLVGNVFGWVTRANTGADGKPILSPAKVKLLADAVYAACGEKNGSTTGVIADPRACHFKPSDLACRTGGGAACLSATEVAAAEKIYAGPVNSRGRALYPGSIPKGSEPFWPRWVSGTDTAPAFMASMVQEFYRYLAFQPPPGPSYKVTDYDFDKDPARMAYAAAMINAATFNPATGEVDFADLSMNAFRDAGGKFIMYHGWADPLVTPQLTVDFYEGLAGKSGGIAATQEFARLFMVPGMDHCGLQTAQQGIADTGIDLLSALEQWVEDGKPPSELVATKMAPTGNQTLWRRPICAYPKFARYKGSGDPSDASSYTCTGP